MLSLNLHRRHLNESQRAMVANNIANLEKGRPSKNPQICGLSQAEAAKRLNVGKRSVEHARKVKTKGTAELVDAVESGKISVSSASTIVDMEESEQRQIVEQVSTGEAKNAEQAKKKITNTKRKEKAQQVKISTPKIFNVILADPPWQYSNSGVDGAAEKQYPTMPTPDICKLLDDIKIQIDSNAVLFLWVTNPLLLDAVDVVKAWGFEYKTNFVWTKDRNSGTGFYIRGAHELLFICTKGSFLPLTSNLPLSVISEKAREHSRKPDSVYEIIESMYPECNYFELFARSQREGWDCYGNEIDKF